MSLKPLVDFYCQNRGFAYCITGELYREFGIVFPQAKLRKQFLDMLNEGLQSNSHQFFLELARCDEKNFAFETEKGEYRMVWKFYESRHNTDDVYFYFIRLLYH